VVRGVRGTVVGCGHQWREERKRQSGAYADRLSQHPVLANQSPFWNTPGRCVKPLFWYTTVVQYCTYNAQTMHSGVVYQNGGYIPAWSVSQWWLAEGVRGWGQCDWQTQCGDTCCSHLSVFYGHRTLHAANHHFDTLQALTETIILIHNRITPGLVISGPSADCRPIDGQW